MTELTFQDRTDHAPSGTDPDPDPIAAALATAGPDVLNRMNVDFEDSVLLVGRILGARPGATAARLTEIDRDGAELVVSDHDGDHRTRLAFPERLTDPMQLTASLYSLVATARERSGETGLTTFERTMAEAAEYRVRLAQVAAVTDLHPQLRQITFTGDDLADLQVTSPDTFLYVLLPPPGRRELTVDRSFTWEGLAEMDPADQPGGAYYTVRHWRPETAELDMLFVLHDNDGTGTGTGNKSHPGSASAWATTARPGDPVALWGPRTSWHPPANTERYLLVADETGLPAAAAILEWLPAEVPVQLVAEAARPAQRQELPERPNTTVTWAYRHGAAPGTTTVLDEAVRSLPWPDGKPYVWGGGESHAMTRVRRYVRDQRGLSREAVNLVAYWRRAV